MENKSNHTDYYYTIEKCERFELKIKGSKFIATASSVKTKEEMQAFLDSIRSEFRDATHNCYAYRLGKAGMEYRFSDDGEPSGTAGKPILFVINKFQLSDIIIVVTRYFGGTKLGAGPLARAYSEAASEVLALCGRKPVYETSKIKVFCTYEDLQNVKKIIDEIAITSEEFFHDSVEITCDIPVSKSSEFSEKINSSTKGRAGIRALSNTL